MTNKFVWPVFVSLLAIATALVIVIVIPVFFSSVRSLHETCSAWLGANSFCSFFPKDLDSTNSAQLSTSLFSAVIAALAALMASALTGWQYEREERRRNERRRELTGLILASEIGAFAEQFNSLLHGARIAALEGQNGTSKPVVQIDHSKVLSILPMQSTYEQLVSDIALMGDRAALAIARFYVQMRRVRAHCEQKELPLYPFAYIIERTSSALLSLDKNNSLGPEIILTMKKIFSKLQSKEFQASSVAAGGNPSEQFGWKNGADVWQRLAQSRKLEASDADD